MLSVSISSLLVSPISPVLLNFETLQRPSSGILHQFVSCKTVRGFWGGGCVIVFSSWLIRLGDHMSQ